MSRRKNETEEEFQLRRKAEDKARYERDKKDPEYMERKRAQARAWYNARKDDPEYKEYQRKRHYEKYHKDIEASRAYGKLKYERVRGDARRFCDEDISLIENYELAKADDFKGWDLHHRLELEDENGNRLDKPRTVKDLKELGLYNHRPASELIYLRHSEHTLLHNIHRQY